MGLRKTGKNSNNDKKGEEKARISSAKHCHDDRRHVLAARDHVI